MRVLLLWLVFWVAAPAAAVAGDDRRPAELPPADFAGRQYIDSLGCVFLRDAEGTWAPRLARDGTAICGYPPTLMARGANGLPRLRALDPDAGKTRAQLLEEKLARVVTGNLQAGELVSDPRPLETLPDMGPEPAPVAPLDALKSALRAAPLIREGMSRDIEPNRRLCTLLGYDTQPVTREALGRDPTQGYCGALPAADLSRLAFARPLGQITGTEAEVPEAAPIQPASARPAPAQPAPARAGKAAAPPLPPPSLVTTASPASRQSAQPGAAPAPRAAAAPPGRVPPVSPVHKPASGAEMIPAGARYVQIGRFPDADKADQAARRVAALGYPVLRGKGADGATLHAGPFDSRQAIVRALNRLRGAGFAQAVAR